MLLIFDKIMKKYKFIKYIIQKMIEDVSNQSIEELNPSVMRIIKKTRYNKKMVP